MTFIPYKGPRIIPNTVDLTIHWTAFGQQCENVYQFRYTTVPTALSLTNLASTFGQAMFNTMKPFLSPSVQFLNATAKDIGAAGRQQGVYTYPNGSTGQAPNDAVALNMASNVNLTTAKVGRRFQGGKSYSGFTESEGTGNTWQSTITTMISNIAVLLLQTWLSGAFTPAIGSLPHMSAIGVVGAPAESNAITGVSQVDLNVDSQKTRLNNRGR